MKFKKIIPLVFALLFFVYGCSPTHPITNPNDNDLTENETYNDDTTDNDTTDDAIENNTADNNSNEDLTNDNTTDGSTDENTDSNTNENTTDDSEDDITNYNTLIKGAWIATVWNLDFPQKATQNNSKLQQEIDEIVLKASSCGLNALFFQARPCADSFYKSNIFPWSRFLTGQQGLAPSNNFDPLNYTIEQCHKAGIELHAWINPLRVTVLSSDKLITTHPANINPELTFKVNDKIFFDPGVPAARKLIIDGVREILQNYDVDGIHFDDYFYPEDINDEDSATWKKYGNSFESIANFRRTSIDELIRQTYMAVKELKPSAAFGVSPSGIWANKSSNPLGSNTRGFESYYAIYADSHGWVKKGYVDYIAPQIYWYIGQSGSDFSIVLNWWHNVCKDTNVILLAGIAAYKAASGGAWNNSSEFTNQMQLATEYGSGYIIFAFSDINFLALS